LLQLKEQTIHNYCLWLSGIICFFLNL